MHNHQRDQNVDERKPIQSLRRAINHSAFRYLFFGGLSFSVDLGLLVLFREVFQWNLSVATAIAFLLSFAFSYTVQKLFSFESAHRTHVSLGRYTLLVGANTIATVFIVQLLSLTGLGYGGAKVVSTAATTVWNYFLYKHWVFGGKQPTRDHVEEENRKDPIHNV
ncbi:GtrA family protein [Pseudarthrobacter sp. NBSH8]|uniref:GtrA family protein n=1 Tax=Pseudarthrobacter sp. NBSH8 TaxID=2596911 RepID=UPI0016284A2F|nr:GtrA family protein [Pseudarthrobacter sp. NBSH8]QNE15156.1 GtrA family protein [Pseudarthrobacter sp. NBSH8]